MLAFSPGYLHLQADMRQTMPDVAPHPASQHVIGFLKFLVLEVFGELSKNLILLATPPRLERGTYCLEGSCSIQLSYGATEVI
jgi:hypothetical protein